MTNTFLGVLSLGQKQLSLGQKQLAKYMYAAATIRVARSALVNLAHVIERIGLALLGGSCGLYVAALMGRESALFASDWIVLLIMLCGAACFYVGTDLPSRPARIATRRPPEGWNSGDAVELFSATGTFIAAVAGVLSIGIVVLDETVTNGLTALIGCCWAIGSALQIAAASIEDGAE